MVTEFIMHKNENMQLHLEVLKARDHLDDLSGDGRIKLVSISGGGGEEEAGLDRVQCAMKEYILYVTR
jgi:hypothetical protein